MHFYGYGSLAEFAPTLKEAHVGEEEDMQVPWKMCAV